MKAFSILLASVLLVTQQATAQSKADQQIKAMIPPDWTPISAAVGDLTGDQRNEMVILLRNIQPLGARVSMMVVVSDADNNAVLDCNSDIAVEDQHGNGPFYEPSALKINQGEVTFTYKYYPDQRTVQDEMHYEYVNGGLHLTYCKQVGRSGNYVWELLADILAESVTIKRWADVSNSQSFPMSQFLDKSFLGDIIPEMPAMCTFDLPNFSRAMVDLAKPVGAPPSAPVAPPVPVATVQTMPKDGLFAYLDFDGDIGDRSPNALKTVQVGGKHVFDGISNQAGAFELDGKSYVQITPPATRLTTPFTVSAWFNAKGEKQLQTVVSMGRNKDGSAFNFGYNFPDKKNAFYFGLVGSKPFGIEYEMSTTGWHFACGTIDSKELKLYIDGSLVATQPVKAFQDIALMTNMTMSNQPIEVGRELATLDRYFTGTIDNVAIYSRVLSETEVNQLRNSSLRSNSGASTSNKSAAQPVAVTNQPAASSTSGPMKVEGVFQDASNADCLHLVFSCGDFGNASINTPYGPQKMIWNELVIWDGNKATPNPRSVGKTFVITYQMVDGVACGESGPKKREVVMFQYKPSGNSEN